ncbi:MAG TPA: hypothetical protein VJT83_10060 [Chitinophagaceae bacterium]|nr:hypothetical protein [Chitinophagaceae bacterium]
MTDDLNGLKTETLHSVYLVESQKFVIALQAGADSTKLTEIRARMKLIMEIIEKREQEKIKNSTK